MSRRSIMTAIATVGAAAAVPALAGPAVGAIMPETSSQPTEIEKVWVRAPALHRECEKHSRLCDKLEKVLVERMPDPHPSIVWGNPPRAGGAKTRSGAQRIR